jgi:hypothetical protein
VTVPEIGYVRVTAGRPPGPPPPELKIYGSVTAIDGIADDADGHVRVQSALARGLPEVGAPSMPRDDPIAIVCGGPSLAQTYWMLQGWSGALWACNGAGSWLLDRAIRPSGIVAMDPCAPARWLDPRIRDVPHYLSNIVPPSFFDAAAGFNVVLWHPWHATAYDPEDKWRIGNGGTVGLRAVYLALHLGWRRIHLFGLDGNMSGRVEHVYDTENFQRPVYEDVFPVTCQGRRFITTLAFAWQAVHLRRLAKETQGVVEFAVYGDSLLSAVMAAGEDIDFHADLTSEQAARIGPLIKLAAKVDSMKGAIL